MHDQIPVNHPVGSTRCGTARTSRAALVALALLALPGLVRAWDPNDAEVEAAIRGGNFAPLMANLTAWLNARTPAAPREISEGTLSAAFREPGFATALARRQFIAKVGVQPLDDFARRDPAVHPFLSWLLRNPEAMELCLEGATPVALAQRSADAWAIPVAALAIWARIWQGDPDSREGLYLKMAIATGLSPPGTGNQGAGQAAKPADPLARHRHFKSAHRNGELFPTFAGLTVWDLRQIMSSNASDEDLAWGRAMVNTWVPQMKAGQKVVDTTSLVWRRNSPIPFDNTFKNVLAGGGKCGPRSSWAVFICQAWGIPAIGLAQPAHAAVGYKDVDGQWKTAYGRSWAASRTAWGSGNEFIEGMEQRLQVRKFMLVERLRWLAAALTPKERGGRVLDLAVALARTPAWLDTAHLAAPPETIRELPSFEAPPNAGDNFTARVRGFVHPPASGEFVFYIASDDDSDLFLSSDEHPGGKKIIAWVRGCTGAKDFDGGGTRQSLPVRLAAGRKYYIEALHREFDGPDHLAVAWSGPGLARAVIPGSHLSPYPSGARGSIAREAWQNPAAPAPAQTPPAPEPPAPTAPGVLHIDAASFFTDGGITIWGGRPGVPLVNSEGGGRQAFFQGSMPSAWAGYRLTVPAPGLYELTARVAAGNKDQSLYVRSFGAMLPVRQATAQHVYRDNAVTHGPQLVVDQDPGTRWSANEGNDQCWLEFDLGRPETISTVMMDERAWNRITKFNLQYRAGQEWRTIFEGTDVGIDYAKDFDPVTAQHLRLNIFDTREQMGYGPTLWEFSVGRVRDGRAWINVPLTYGLWQVTEPVDIRLPGGEQELWVFAPFQRGVAVKWFELKPKASGVAPRAEEPQRPILLAPKQEDPD